MKKYLLPLVAMLAMAGCKQMTPAGHAAEHQAILKKADSNYRVACIGGYQFVHNPFGTVATQILNSEGKGIPCE